MKKIKKVLLSLALLLLIFPFNEVLASRTDIVISGPATLAPGESANYKITFNSNETSFYKYQITGSNLALSGAVSSEVFGDGENKSNSLTVKATASNSATSATLSVSGIATYTSGSSIGVEKPISTSITVAIKKPTPTPPPAKPATPSPSKPTTPAPSDTRSSNNFLRSLTVSEGSLAFSRNTTAYRVVVENSVTSISLGASAEDSKSTVTGLGSKSLDVYDNNMNVSVKAENGSVKTYSINVVRKDADGNEKKPENNNSLESLTIEGCEIDFSKDKLVYNCEVSNLIDSLAIEASPEDSKASIKILNNDKLVNGNNEVKIIVTAENKEEKEYVINVIRSTDAPTVKIEDLSDALKKITVDEIIVEPNKDGLISKEVLLEIKNANKVMYVYSLDKDENILYKWKFDGKNLSDLNDVNTSLNFNSKNVDSIDKLSNFAKGFNLVLANNPSLPKGIELGVNVEDEYADETLLNLYYYDGEKNSLSLEHKDLEIVDGYVWMSLEHASEYLLTPASINNISTLDNPLLISTIILAIALVLSFGVILLQKQRFSKIKRNITLNK